MAFPVVNALRVKRSSSQAIDYSILCTWVDFLRNSPTHSTFDRPNFNLEIDIYTLMEDNSMFRNWKKEETLFFFPLMGKGK